MVNYLFSTADGTQIGLGSLDVQGRIELSAGGAPQLDRGEVDAANAERTRRVNEAVAGARKRFAPTLAKLTEARSAMDAARAEERDAGAALVEAKRDHAEAVRAAQNPGPTRRAIQDAEQRVGDAVVWLRSATARLAEIEQHAREAAAVAWRQEIESRRTALEAERAKLAKAAGELLADLARIGLAALPADAVLIGQFPIEELIAEPVPQPGGLKLAAG